MFEKQGNFTGHFIALDGHQILIYLLGRHHKGPTTELAGKPQRSVCHCHEGNSLSREAQTIISLATSFNFDQIQTRGIGLSRPLHVSATRPTKYWTPMVFPSSGRPTGGWTMSLFKVEYNWAPWTGSPWPAPSPGLAPGRVTSNPPDRARYSVVVFFIWVFLD